MELHLIIGPMFAGKSTELIRRARRFRSINKTVLAINHTLNVRYGSNQITTHSNGIFEGCLIGDTLQQIESSNAGEFEKADVIIIEELQFFADALAKIVEWVESKNKIVVAAGLDGDSERKEFGDVLKLIPYADTVFKISALCPYCKDGTAAHFTKRLTTEKTVITVGSSNEYAAVCRKHYKHN